jgi:glucose-6-phosphate 1-dehydrogenase
VTCRRSSRSSALPGAKRPTRVFRAELETGNRKNSRQGHNDELWGSFAQCIHYHRSEFEDPAGYVQLKLLLDKFDHERGAPANRLFYLASAPEYFKPILEMIRAAGLNEGVGGKWARVVCEKPLARISPPRVA